MQVIINTDHNITLTESARSDMQSVVELKFEHFASRLTRVEVHLSDESAGRSTGNDIRCRLEARPEGRNADFVTDEAASVDEALHGALRKMAHVLETIFGRMDHHKGGESIRGAEPR